MSQPLHQPNSSIIQDPFYLHLQKSCKHTKTSFTITNLLTHPYVYKPKIFSAFLRKTTKKLQTTKKLKKLILDLGPAPLQLDDFKEIDNFLLKDLHHIESLKINFIPSFKVSQYLKIILQALKRCQSLKSFEMTVPNLCVGNYSIADLVKQLYRSAPRLRHLKLTHFPGRFTYPISPLLLRLNEWNLKWLRNLQMLTLHLPKDIFLNFEQNKVDLSALKRFTKLKYLDISIVEGNYDQLERISGDLTFHPKKLFPNLITFKWALLWRSVFSHPLLKPTKTRLELLGSDIASHLENLRDVSFRLRPNGKLNDSQMESLAQSWKASKANMNKLSLVFDDGELIQQEADNFFHALSDPKLNTIETFSLDVSYSRGINNGFLAKLAQTIGQNMNGIRYLKLSFNFHHGVQSHFQEAMKAIFGYEGISDRGIKKLGSLLSEKCRNLEFVNLRFSKYSQISDSGVKSLCDRLSKIQSLKRVWLRFGFSAKVTIESEKYALKKLGLNREIKFWRVDNHYIIE